MEQSDPSIPRAAAPRRFGLAARAAALIVSLGVFALGGAWLFHSSIDPAEERDIAHLPAVRSEALADIKSWGYQLQGLRVGEAARSPYDLLVVDEQLEGSGSGPRGLALSALKRKPDGSRRLVLAYVSIGEAETYRAYWHKSWTRMAAAPDVTERAAEVLPVGGPAALPSPTREALTKAKLRPAQVPTAAAPSWLGPENPDWRGNFVVRFWDPGWQSILFGRETSVIDRLIAAGFDGIYLDRADVHASWTGERPKARADMADLIVRLSAYAKGKNPDFLVALQNAEELLATRQVRRALDLVAKEDLYFGIAGDGLANGEQDVKGSLAHLKRAQSDGLPILVVEYLDERQKIDTVRNALESHGFISYFAPRELNRMRTGP